MVVPKPKIDYKKLEGAVELGKVEKEEALEAAKERRIVSILDKERLDFILTSRGPERRVFFVGRENNPGYVRVIMDAINTDPYCFEPTTPEIKDMVVLYRINSTKFRFDMMQNNLIMVNSGKDGNPSLWRYDIAQIGREEDVFIPMAYIPIEQYKKFLKFVYGPWRIEEEGHKRPEAWFQLTLPLTPPEK